MKGIAGEDHITLVLWFVGNKGLMEKYESRLYFTSDKHRSSITLKGSLENIINKRYHERNDDNKDEKNGYS